MATPSWSPKDDTARLVELRDRAAKAYYLSSEPLMTDPEFDALVLELDSRGVGRPVGVDAEAIPQSRKVRLSRPMLSLANVYGDRALDKWVAEQGDYGSLCIQPKYDGLACSITYVDDTLSSAATRGDGLVGEDVTLQVRASGMVPIKLPRGSCSKGPIEVRGEVYLTPRNLEEINLRLKAEGYSLYKDHRGAAAGILRRLDETWRSEYLSFVAYDFSDSKPHQTYVHAMETAAKLGFATPAAQELQFVLTPEPSPYRDSDKGIEKLAPAWKIELDEIMSTFFSFRDSGAFEIDGVVFRLNDLATCRRMGDNGHHPNWAVAFKFPEREATTTLLDIVWQVGRTGRLTPVAELQPVDMKGRVVRRATLHNAKQLSELDVRVGDRVTVVVAKDIIPQVRGVVGAHRKGAKRIPIPVNCPNCGTSLKTSGNNGDPVCPNTECAPERKIVHGLKSLSVEGVSWDVVEQLVGMGKVADIVDMVSVTNSDLEQLEGFTEYSAEKAMHSLSVMRQASLGAWIAALGIPGVGSSLGWVLESEFDSLEDLANSTEDELVRLDGIGYERASTITSHKKLILDVASRLKKVGVIPEPLETYDEEEPPENELNGLNVVVTGVLPTMTRSEVEQAVYKLGGVFQGSVNGKTDILVVGDNPGASKISKADSLGTQIMSGLDFEALARSVLH